MRRTSLRTASPAAVALAALAACGDADRNPDDAGGAPPDVPAGLFADVTGSSGLALDLTAGGGEPRQIVEVKGGGLAVLDHDNDGDLDVFAPNGATLEAPDAGAGARLFANDGALAFHDATAEAGLDWHGWGMGVAAGDVDADGFEDLFVAAFGRDALLRNEAGRFREATGEAGLGDEGWGTGSAFGDLDMDGDLDLYLVRYLELDLAHPPPPTTFLGVSVFDGPAGLEPLADRVFANDGAGRFTDVTAAWGCAEVKPSYGLGCLVLDLDADGFTDVYVGNDSMPNFLFRGRAAGAGEPRFVESALTAGLAVNADGEAQATMGIAYGDVNADGRADLFSTNFMTDTNTLFVTTPSEGFYADRTQLYGLAMVSRPFLGWAAAFADVDLDGDEDLLAFNGHVYPDQAVTALGSTSRQEPLCFLREGDRFRRVLAAEGGAWLDARHNDRSALCADLDADGDLDVVVAERDGPVRLLRGLAADRPHEAGGAGRGLVVRLRDARPGARNPRGVGARVALVDAAGATLATRWIAGGGSYLAGSPAEVHLALPAAAADLALVVRWPDGVEERRALDAAVGPRVEVVRR
jgi:hypothetical protein